MKNYKNLFVAIFILLSVLLTYTGCRDSRNPVSQKASSEQEMNSLVIRLSGGDFGLPNPFKHYMRGPGISKMWLLYDSLLERDEKGDIPWLAASWKINEDGTIYTFFLQEDALWHDGESLTAEDVAFSFDYYRDHPPVYNKLVANGEYIVKGTKVIDTYTVEITFNTFDNTNLSKIGYSRILPKHIWENVSDPVTFTGEGSTTGSGPFVMESYTAEHGTYRYTAFEEYWGLEPKVSAIEWIPVSDSVLAFENGEIDLMMAPPDILSRYEDNSEYKVEKKSSYHSYRLMMNMDNRNELQNADLRRALAYGINPQEMIDKVSRGSATISSMGYVPMESSWYNSDTEQYNFNIEKAKELLGGKTYSFDVLTGNSASDIKIAELMKLTLAQAGIDLTIKSVDSKVRDTTVRTGQYELLVIYYGGMGGDPDYLRSMYGNQSASGGLQNIIGYQNKLIYELVQKQAVERDASKRRELIFEAQKIIADEVPMILLISSDVNFIYRPGKYDGWMFRYDHNITQHNKLSYLKR